MPLLRGTHLPEAHRICNVVFEGIESLFGGNWANSSSVRDKCPWQFSHGRERSISMYGEWWVKTWPHWQVCGSLCVSCTMLRQSQRPRRVPREHAECFLSIVRLMGAINALLPYNCTKGSPLTFPAVTRRTFPLWMWKKYLNVWLH